MRASILVYFVKTLPILCPNFLGNPLSGFNLPGSIGKVRFGDDVVEHDWCVCGAQVLQAWTPAGDWRRPKSQGTSDCQLEQLDSQGWSTTAPFKPRSHSRSGYSTQNAQLRFRNDANSIPAIVHEKTSSSSAVRLLTEVSDATRKRGMG